MKKFVFCSIAAMLLAGTFCACGDDEEELDYDTIENESGGGTATETKVDIVGRTVVYNQVSETHGNINTMTLTLKFTSSSAYSIRKQSTYYKWSNGAYRQYFYDQTKTGTYSVSGTKITMKSNWPFWDGSDSERWSSDDWVLIYRGNFLTNEDQSDQNEPTWTFLR